MIVDVYLIVFNCVFSRAVTLNRCFNDDIMSSHHRTYYYFFGKKAPGRPAPAVSQRGHIPFHGNLIIFIAFDSSPT